MAQRKKIHQAVTQYLLVDTFTVDLGVFMGFVDRIMQPCHLRNKPQKHTE